jgi:hypothetical protein
MVNLINLFICLFFNCLCVLYNKLTPKGYFEKVRIEKSAEQPNSRDFTYMMLGGGRFLYASVARLGLIKV